MKSSLNSTQYVRKSLITANLKFNSNSTYFTRRRDFLKKETSYQNN